MTEMEICVLFSLLPLLFALAHTHSRSGHIETFDSFKNVRQKFLWPARKKEIVCLTEDCIEDQTNKSNRQNLQEAILEQWGKFETTPFILKHIDYKGPLRPNSNPNTPCLVVVDAFFRFLVAYHATDTGV